MSSRGARGGKARLELDRRASEKADIRLFRVSYFAVWQNTRSQACQKVPDGDFFDKLEKTGLLIPYLVKEYQCACVPPHRCFCSDRERDRCGHGFKTARASGRQHDGVFLRTSHRGTKTEGHRMYCRCFTAEKAGVKQAEEPEKRKTCAKFAPKLLSNKRHMIIA